MGKSPTGRILFIDDDKAGREVALFNLRRAGYEITPAEDGQEGLSFFSPEKFDLVVTDVKMPGISGIEVLRRIKKQAPEIPVLVITAFGNVETAVEAMKNGAYDFIGKPFQRDQLLLQAKLLRALQEKVVDAVGGDAPISVDVRIVAATNKDLQSRVRAGSFREDLYYRLNVVEVHVPPLRERTEDVPALVLHFVGELAEGRDLIVPPRVMEELMRRPWPGNVRELKNACERMVILCYGDEMSLDDLPAPSDWLRPEKAPLLGNGGGLPSLPPDGLSLMDLEKKVIESALRIKNGNMTQAAAFLRIPRHVLIYRLEKYGIRRGGSLLPQSGHSEPEAAPSQAEVE